ncbi:MAG: CocE/NonD family hydrolase [Gemmatimonadetes bacterium]|nr:CocE/NonD family hydrolase [Gemmatimonadota bacterium]
MRNSRVWIGHVAGLAGLALLGGSASAQQRQQARPQLQQQQSSLLENPMVVEYDVKVPMKDGVKLSVDIYRPVGGGPVPTVFQETPYGNISDGTMEQAWRLVRRGYAYAVVDTRGRYDSEGEFYPYRHDGPDGSEVMTWIAAQPWSNGKIATTGGSYSGKNQWLMARENNPHHVAIMATVAGADEFHDGSRYNGVPKVDLRYTWTMGMDGRVGQPRAGWDWPAIMRQLPLVGLDRVAGRDIHYWRELMEHDSFDSYWDPVTVRGYYEGFDKPSLSVTGWFDGQLKGAMQHYLNEVRTAKNPSDHYLIIGPWPHGVNSTRQLGERDYGPDAIIDLEGIRDAWLDYHMLGKAKADQPNVMYFLPGKNAWRSASAFPIPKTEFTQYFLDSQGKANTLFGDGALRAGTPGTGRPDEFVYDPANPVPTISSRTAGARGGLAQGSVDNRAVETRPDVLVYTSEPLREGVEVTGPVKATIQFSTDVPDTDIAVKLLDVYPDGRAHNITEGIARARFRNSFTQAEMLEPGKVYSIEVELFPTSNFFLPGHRIRIEVAGSDFPNFGRNLNTGKNNETTTEMRPARIRMYHTRENPSSITLPIVPPGTTVSYRT